MLIGFQSAPVKPHEKKNVGPSRKRAGPSSFYEVQ